MRALGVQSGRPCVQRCESSEQVLPYLMVLLLFPCSHHCHHQPISLLHQKFFLVLSSVPLNLPASAPSISSCTDVSHRAENRTFYQPLLPFLTFFIPSHHNSDHCYLTQVIAVLSPASFSFTKTKTAQVLVLILYSNSDRDICIQKSDKLPKQYLQLQL